jgi:ABC-2 type transport system ATP-binding protein
MKQILVRINNLSKSFDQTEHYALDNLSAQIMNGLITGLVGPDGAGKTTLIRIIAGLLLPSSGRVKVKEFDIVKNPYKIQNFISYMPQKFGLYEDLSVIENLNLYADLRDVTGKERLDRFETLLDFTDLKHFKKRLAGNLSGGMKQKLGLACSLVKKPELLLLDEPGVGVDPVSRRELWRMVKELVDDGMAVIWSTAYLDEAEKCDEVILLNNGKALYSGIPANLKSRVTKRVFQVQNVRTNIRNILMNALNNDMVIDGIIQGSNIRLVTKHQNSCPANKDLGIDENILIKTVEPRFEDAFIDILGGGPGGTSELTQILEKIDLDNQNVIEANNLTRKFGEFTAVKDASFSVAKGEIFGLLGPNGAGKSTIFKMMCGLLKPTGGSVKIAGKDLIKAPAEARARIGYMAQKFSLYELLSVDQNLNFFAGIYGLKGKKKKALINRMKGIFDLEKYSDKSAIELPPGFKQRLSLVCSVMHNPAILFLDEPTSGVDPITRREFWTHINGMVQKDVTIMVTTHFMDEAENCDRIGLVYRGQIIAIDTPDGLKEKVKTDLMPDPDLEDAFIELIRQYDRRVESEAA